MVKRFIAGALSGVVAAMILALPVFAQVPADLVPTCIGRTEWVTVTAGMEMLPAALEVDLLLENRGRVSLRFDPSEAALQTSEGRLSPWTADETKRAHRDFGGYFVGGALLGPFGLVVSGLSQLSFNRYVDSRAFRTVDVPSGQSVRGSLFFPVPAKGGTRAALEFSGLSSLSGESLGPVRLYCTLPRRASEAPVAAGVAPVTVSLTAGAAAGPADVTVGAVEFAAEYTAVEMTLINNADTEADIFAAMVNTTLADANGVAYLVRSIRSDFTDRILPKASVSARLVFAPLPPPPSTSTATLTVPGIRYGLDTVDVKVEIRF